MSKPHYRLVNGVPVLVRPMNAVTKVIHIVGLSQLAKECDVTYQAVRKWERGRVPAERCRDIVRIVNERSPGALSLSDLRPDLWPVPGTTDEAA